MIVVVVLLAVVAVVAIVLAVVTRSKLAEQRRATAEATETAEQMAGERDTERARAEAVEVARNEAMARAEAAETARDEAVIRAEVAETEAADARAGADEAASRATEAEKQAAEAAARNGLDPELVWTLERARSERTWRHSVAVGPDDTPILANAEHPLREALQVEVDAAREDVGAVVELKVDIPQHVTAAGSALVLRTAQELLARAVKTADEATLHVWADGDDVIVTIVATDDGSTIVPIAPLNMPPTRDVETDGSAIRVKHALRTEGA